MADLEQITALLGGGRVLGHPLRTPFEAHDLLQRGLPGEALAHLVGHVGALKRGGSLEKAVGISLRTFQRRKKAPDRRLSPEQSGRTWKFAEVLARAIAVFGSQDLAEDWLVKPALGLDGRRPIDLMATPAGIELVETFLERLDHGVYM